MNNLIPILLLFFCLSSQALTVQDAITMAKDHSPDILALRNQWASAEAKASQALAPTEPTLSVQYNDMVKAFYNNDPGSTVYQVNQPIAFPGKSFVNHSALGNQAKSIEAQLHSMELQVATNTKTTYQQLALARENIRLNEDQKAAYERILAIAKRRYEAGSIPQVDLLNAQVSLYASTNDVNDLKALEKTARAQLNLLLGNQPEAEISIDPVRAQIITLPTFAEAREKMVEKRNELKAARFQLHAAQDNYTLAKMSWLPDFQITAGTTYYNILTASPLNASSPDVQRTYLLGVQMTFPLWGLFNESQGIKSAAKDRAAADANLQVVVNQSLVTLTTSLETLRALQSRLQNYEEHLLPLSEQALSLALISYSAGKIDFQTLVDTASSRRNIRRDYLTALLNAQTNYSSLGQLLGEEL